VLKLGEKIIPESPEARYLRLMAEEQGLVPKKK